MGGCRPLYCAGVDGLGLLIVCFNAVRAIYCGCAATCSSHTISAKRVQACSHHWLCRLHANGAILVTYQCQLHACVAASRGCYIGRAVELCCNN
jgi:hypothetical protein